MMKMLHEKVQDAINSAHGGFLSGNVTDAAIRAVLEWAEEMACNLDKAQGFGNARLAFISALREEFGK